MASKLETGSSSSVAVGERAARTTVEHACSHRRRHERHERRVQRHLPSRAILLSYLSLYRSSSGLLFLFVRGDAGAAMQ
jgi:hypothetical protein